jgi:hypothetical protein
MLVKKKLLVLSLCIPLLIIGWYLINYFLVYLAVKTPACDYEKAKYGSGRNEESKKCTCSGIKIVVDNSLPRDGAYKTVCLGNATTPN